MQTPTSGTVSLLRGGLLVYTSQGSIQFGVPPETIKDTMVDARGVPDIFVLVKQLFDLERGVNFAELEFPVYFNFFVKQRKIRVVCEAEQKQKVLELIGETLFPPVPHMLHLEFVRGLQCPTLPNMARELQYFQRHPRDPSRFITVDDILEFHLLTPDGEGNLQCRINHVCIRLDKARGLFSVTDGAEKLATVPWDLRIPTYRPEVRAEEVFAPPLFGISALGNGSGFDPSSDTSGFVVWVNGRGIMVDPPVDSTLHLKDLRIAPRLIQDVVLTHCHADHDAGVLQKVLEEGIIRLYTTPSIMEGFLRKASLITGLSIRQIEQMIEFHPIPIEVPFAILGARFVFKYNFHSVPTLRFQVFYRGRSLVYSSDILNIPSTLKTIASEGVFSPGRLEDLLAFPWDADLIIHEAGIPPLHTPPSALDLLPADVKKRLYVVHTTEARVKEFPDLKMMTPGIEHTLIFELEEMPATLAHRCLRALASNEVLRAISVDRAADLIQVAELRSLLAGEYLIKKGDFGQEIYLLLHGEVSVIRDNRLYKVYGSGELVGDMALVNDEPRFADVIARSNIQYLAMKKEDFISVLQLSGVLEYLQHLAEIRKQDSWPLIEHSEILDFLTVTQRTALQGLMRPCELPQGFRLESHQLRPPEAFLLIDGEVKVTLLDGVEGVLGRGALIGLFGSPDGRFEQEGFCFTALSPIQAYHLSDAPLQRFLERNPGMWLRLNRRTRLELQLKCDA